VGVALRRERIGTENPGSSFWGSSTAFVRETFESGQGIATPCAPKSFKVISPSEVAFSTKRWIAMRTRVDRETPVRSASSANALSVAWSRRVEEGTLEVFNIGDTTYLFSECK
jgi:hypothetical protein